MACGLCPVPCGLCPVSWLVSRRCFLGPSECWAEVVHKQAYERLSVLGLGVSAVRAQCCRRHREQESVDCLDHACAMMTKICKMTKCENFFETSSSPSFGTSV